MIKNRTISYAIDKIISEAINEYGAFRKFNKKTDKASLSISYLSRDARFNKAANQNKEYINVFLFNGKDDKKGDTQKLANAINSVVPKQIMYASITSKNNVVLIVNPETKNDIPTYTAKLIAAVNQLGEYVESSVDRTFSELFDNVDGIATEEDEKNAENASMATWQEILKKLQDPEIRDRLLAYQMVHEENTAFGHLLSPNNVQKIRNQFPNASFVAEATTWKRYFNRTIQPNAQRIVVRKKLKGNLPTKVLDDAARSLGYKSFKDAMDRTNHSPQVKNQIEIQAQGGKGRLDNFLTVIMYDVSQTIPPPDPKDDIWTNKIGLANNLIGEPNQKATEFVNKEKAARDALEANTKVASETQQKKWVMRRKKLTDLLKKEKIDLSQLMNSSDDAFIPNATYLYAKTQCPKYNYVKKEDVEMASLACALSVCISCGCPVPDKVKYAYDEIARKTTPEFVQVVCAIVSDILPRLSVRTDDPNRFKTIVGETYKNMKKLLKEYKENEIIPMSEFIDIIKNTFGSYTGDEDVEINAEMESIKREFDNTTNKLNENKWADLRFE